MPEITFRLTVPAALRRIGALMDDDQPELIEAALAAAVQEYIFTLANEQYQGLADAAYRAGFDSESAYRACEVLEAFACGVFELSPEDSGYDLAAAGLELLWDDANAGGEVDVSLVDGDDADDEDDEGEEADPHVELLVNLAQYQDPDRNEGMIADVVGRVGFEPSSVDHLNRSIDVLFHYASFDEANAMAEELNKLDFVNGATAYDPETGEGDR